MLKKELNVENTIYKSLKEIEEKFGIRAYNEIVNLIGKQQERIDDLKKSRENWKRKYETLKKAKE